MTEEDKKFVELHEKTYAGSHFIQRLCRIIRELDGCHHAWLDLKYEIENAPWVYGRVGPDNLWMVFTDTRSPDHDTHRAKLVWVEKLEGKK